MKEKKEIVENWLPRYTGTPLAEFGEYIKSEMSKWSRVVREGGITTQ